jgi:AraC-like DNA-binding protein
MTTEVPESSEAAKPPIKLRRRARAKTDKRKHLTMRQWAEVEALWESGDMKLTDLMAKFGVSKSTLSRHFKVRGVKRASRAAEVKDAVAKANAKAAAMEASLLTERIKETKEQHYSMARNLTMITWKEVMDCRNRGDALSTILPNLKSLEAAAKVLTTCRNERYVVLGLDRPDAVDVQTIPELVISELTANQVEALQNRSFSLYDDEAPVSEASDDLSPEDDDDAVVEE